MDAILPPNMPTDEAWEVEVTYQGRKFAVAHYESPAGWRFVTPHVFDTNNPDAWCYSTGPNSTTDPETAIREHPVNCGDNRAMQARDALSPWHSCKSDLCCEWRGKSAWTVRQTTTRLERYAQSNYEEPKRSARAARPSGDNWHRSTPEMRQRAVEMIEAGATQAEVGRQLGFSRAAVSLWVARRKGIDN